MMIRHRDPTARRLLAGLSGLLLLVGGCGLFIPEGAPSPHADGTWVGYAASGTAVPVMGREQGSWPVVILRDAKGPRIPEPSGGPPKPLPKGAVPLDPVLVDSDLRIIRLCDVQVGEGLAVSGRSFGGSDQLRGPGGMPVTLFGAGWVFGDPAIRVDRVQRIMPDGSRRKVRWTTVER